MLQVEADKKVYQQCLRSLPSVSVTFTQHACAFYPACLRL